MPTTHSTGISLLDIGRSLLRHRRLAVGFLLVTLVITVVALKLIPRSFRSEGKLFIRMGRESTTLDAAATIGRSAPTSALPLERENAINSATQILQSRVLIEKVVEALGPAVILAGIDPVEPDQESVLAGGSQGGVASSLRNVAAYVLPLSPPLSDHERAILQLQKMVYVQPVKHSDVLGVSCESNGPKLSQQIVARLIDFYLAEHLRLNRTSGVREFLERQTLEMHRLLTTADEELRAMKDASQLASPETEADLMTGRAAAARGRIVGDHGIAGQCRGSCRPVACQTRILAEIGRDVSHRGDFQSRYAAHGATSCIGFNWPSRSWRLD